MSLPSPTDLESHTGVDGEGADGEDGSLTKMGVISKVTSPDLGVCKTWSSLRKADSNLISIQSSRVGYGTVLQPSVAPQLLHAGPPTVAPNKQHGVRSLPAACSGPWKDSQPQVLGRCLLAP